MRGNRLICLLMMQLQQLQLLTLTLPVIQKLLKHLSRYENINNKPSRQVAAKYFVIGCKTSIVSGQM